MYFIEEKIKRTLEDISNYRYPQSYAITPIKIKHGNFREGYLENTENFEAFGPDDNWTGADKHSYFRMTATVPQSFYGKTVFLRIQTGRENDWDLVGNPQFIVHINGKITQALDANHTELFLTENAQAFETFEIGLHAYSGSKEGHLELRAFLVELDRSTEKLYYDMNVPYEVAVLLPKGDKKRVEILKHLDKAANKLDLREPFSPYYIMSVSKATEYMESQFYGKEHGEYEGSVICIGHTHIDVAWLWTLARTREKVVRSFSTVLSLMKQYPEYKFMSSQPQLYKFLKEDCPEAFEEVKERIKEGRWEAEGAMWLEADCNLTSGESLIRQILFGTRFFEKEFKIKNRILWLPDVFGYSAALPQILKKSGIDYFMTTKISWSEFNKMPYDTFMWEGIDGTKLLTNFVTTKDLVSAPWLFPYTTTYNGVINPSQVMGAWDRYQQKELNDEVLLPFGYGDGGGGPTKDMLENGRRMAKGIPGCPKVKMGTSREFFEKLEKDVKNNKDLPNWVGELYLEYHRGTYTSMARNKKFNRKSEFLYEDAELISVMSSKIANGKYEQDKINNGWETILLNQFHDILPGSSIKAVYEESRDQYIELQKSGREVLNNAIANIAKDISLQDKSVVLFNQLSFERDDIAEFKLPDNFEDAEVYDIKGDKILSQTTYDGSIIFFAKNIPSKGYKSFKLRKCNKKRYDDKFSLKADKRLLQNKFFEIAFDEKANITSIFDKLNNREVLKEGQRANVIQAFEDKPAAFDAWDIDIYYQEKMWEVNNLESIEIVECGPVRAALKVTKKFLKSKIIQYIYIYNDIPRIDFKTTIDWKEKQILLKAAFPVDIHSSKATYEIQYGNVERPTHWNTSWDYAKFEVCAHKWADISEDGYGVSLLNDCKYGHDIKDSVMRLTLLKSAISPNEDADREIHDFTYSLYPHAYGWRDADTVSMAYRINCPLYTIVEGAHEGILNSEFSLIKVNQSNVVIEVVKKAEDSDDIIIRLYECFNKRSKVDLTFFKSIDTVYECDMMEKNIEKVESSGNSFKFDIKNYEIKTFKISTK